ncbi:sigma-70 family RNA polymerase sigma factor [Prosthecobacter sp.]|uniref:sigma-70 family RNA polymerase sigma factor n=1 Tax=Prosthecobacter sp. TaxID=1965333 RepID=UPI00378524BB
MDSSMPERDEGLEIYLNEIEKAKARLLALKGAVGEREVRAQMIREHLRLVVRIAQEQQAQGEIPMLDLISAGNIGLMKAVARFDPEKEGALPAFAAWWIRQAIKREVKKRAGKFQDLCAPLKPHLGSAEDLALPA